MPVTNDRIRFLRGLRAVRDYTADPVSDEVLSDILEVGRWTGSASNRQPTEVVVVRDRAILDQIGASGVGPAAGAPVAIVVLTPDDPSRTEVNAFDTGRLVERVLLAAHAHGLGGNIGTLKGDGIATIKQALSIPDGLKPWAVVTLGTTDERARNARPKNPNPGRKALADFAHSEHY